MPLSCCVAYILAGPIVNVLVIATTYQAFLGQEKMTSINQATGQTMYQMGSFWMIGFRVSLGYLVAVVTAFVVEAQYKKYGYKLISPSLQLPTKPVANGAECSASAASPRRRCTTSRPSPCC
jgi:uncharacterized membrane protein YraQ (UPF0718 family)